MIDTYDEYRSGLVRVKDEQRTESSSDLLLYRVQLE